MTPETRHWPLPLAVALLSLIAVVATLDSSGAVPPLGEGPGLTLDETFNVQMGVYHVRAIREYGLALLHPNSIKEVFGDPAYNPDHPPLGRFFLGIAHDASFGILNPDVPDDSVCVTCARVGTAFAFAMTVFLVGWTTARWYGRAAGVIAALSMLLMPRLLAHAHMASLETFVSLMYVATILWVANKWTGTSPPSKRVIVMGGVLFGLCLLTKIQAVLLPIPIGMWTLWRWRVRAVLPMLGFGVIGLLVFFAGWPWLWLDPVNHLAEYFGRTTERLTLYCWYMNHKWADIDVPWHYSFVMFAVTVPIGLHALGLLGAISRTDDSGESHEDAAARRRYLPPSAFLLLNVLWPVMFFAIPGITVYDGTRLFLMVFPLWAILVGRGGALLIDWIRKRWGRAAMVAVMTLLLATQSYSIIATHPLGLSYYNGLTGGLRGASELGFESTYWGDSVTRSFLEDVAAELPEGATLYVAPVLHPFQLGELATQTPALRRHKITLRAYDDKTGEQIRYVLVIRRHADSWTSLEPTPAGTLLAEITRDGVQLAALYTIDATSE